MRHEQMQQFGHLPGMRHFPDEYASWDVRLESKEITSSSINLEIGRHLSSRAGAFALANRAASLIFCLSAVLLASSRTTPKRYEFMKKKP